MVWVLRIGMALLLFSLWAAAQPLIIPRVVNLPIVDGQIGDAAWTQAPTLTLTHRLGGDISQTKTTVRLCFSDTHDALFILFICEEPAPEKMKRQVRQHDGEVWTDDCVEIFLAPDPKEPVSYYHIVVNSLGVLRDEFWQDGKDDTGWDSKAQIKTRLMSNLWVAEIAIPFASFDRNPILSDTWKANFGRERWAVTPPEISSWQPCQFSFHEPERFGEVTLPGVSSLQGVRLRSAKIVREEVRKTLLVLDGLLMLLPKQPSSAMGKQTVVTLREWQQKLNDATENEWMWQKVQDARRHLPQWEATVMRAKLVEQLRRSYAVFAVSPMTKLRPEEVPTGKPVTQTQLFAAKGESESLQLVITALEQPLRGVKFSATPLVGPKGFLIFPEVRLVGYVPVQKPTPGGFGIVGRYPDPLLPLHPFDVPQGESQAVWLTVFVPQDAVAGEYEGAVTVKPQNADETTVRLRLRVFNVTLPTQSFLKTCVLIWDGHAQRVYGEAWTPERSRRFYEQCLRYRFTPPPPLPWDKVFVRQPNGTWTAKWDEFDREVEGWMRKGATAFSIGGILRWGTKPPPEGEQSEAAAKLHLLGEHLRQKGWSQRFYFYVFDEPSATEWDNIKRLCSFVRQHAPNLQVLLTAGYGATGKFRTHAPTPEGAAYRGLADAIKIWVPHIDCFDETFLRQRKEAGDQVWMYVCISTVGKTYPDIWRIDWTGVSHRAIGWWLWRYGCDGFLYWCVNYWTDDKGKPFDLFANPTAYPGGNGDGFLFYPDPQKGDPIPSVRAELMRDGIEDYDLLCLLRDSVARVKANKRAARRLAKVLTQAEKLLRADGLIIAPNKFIDDPQVYERQHQQILEALEKLLGAP